MKLRIRVRHGELAPAELELVRRRVWFALGRLSTVIQRVDVQLADAETPHGIERQCRLRISAPRMPALVVEHAGRDLLEVVGLAAERAHRGVVRALGRRRGPSPAIAT